MALSGPQLKFCEGILEGMTQVDAYRRAYPKCSAKAAESKASRAVRNGKVARYIATKRAEAEKASSVTREKAIERLWGIANAPDCVPQAVGAIAQISKMMGWDKPQQVEIAVNPLRKLLDEISGTSTGL